MHTGLLFWLAPVRSGEICKPVTQVAPFDVTRKSSVRLACGAFTGKRRFTVFTHTRTRKHLLLKLGEVAVDV